MSDITEARRRAIQETIRPIAVEDLKAMEEDLFPYQDAPWREAFSDFLKVNAGSTFYHATTHDRVHIIYCHTKEKGIWYIPGSGLGPLQEKGLKIMKKIVEKA
ncbi:MAG: hypothetical protein P4L99_25965 [Chthoniobacter sp.]|nr:hypothetical protein [Chthoniobacter sp.]